jgi:hypothetical protein
MGEKQKVRRWEGGKRRSAKGKGKGKESAEG